MVADVIREIEQEFYKNIFRQREKNVFRAQM